MKMIKLENMKRHWQFLKTKKVKTAPALALIFVITCISAFFIAKQVISAGMPYVGMRIISPIVKKCVNDPDPPYCYGTCKTCGQLENCAGLYEIEFKMIGGSASAKTDFLKSLGGNYAMCIDTPKPPKTGTFRANGYCIGSYFPILKGTQRLNQNFGCSK